MTFVRDKDGICRTCNKFKKIRGRRCSNCVNKERYHSQRKSDCHPNRKWYVGGQCKQCWLESRPSSSCHPSEKEYAHNLCRVCYDARRKEERVKRARERNYGVDEEKYQSLLDKHDGKCPICGEEANSIDHDHETNEVRGLLCKTCNAGLGMFKDSPTVLFKAAEYLSAHKGNHVQTQSQETRS